MGCKGVECRRHKAKKPLSGGRYANGQARCQVCEIYMYWDGVFCPCCDTRLRRTPRKAQYKEQTRAERALNEEDKIETGKVNIITEMRARDEV